MLTWLFKTFFKDRGFSEENEWRAVLQMHRSKGTAARARTVNNPEIPYVEMIFPQSRIRSRLPIAEIAPGTDGPPFSE